MSCDAVADNAARHHDFDVKYFFVSLKYGVDTQMTSLIYNYLLMKLWLLLAS